MNNNKKIRGQLEEIINQTLSNESCSEVNFEIGEFVKDFKH